MTERTEVLYIANPKTASSSIAKSVSGVGETGPDHRNYREVIPELTKLGVDLNTLFLFTSCRHPFTRFQSWAYDSDMRSMRNFGINWIEEGMSMEDLILFVKDNVTIVNNGLDFTHWSMTKGEMLGSHLQPQTSFIVDESLQPRHNGAIRFEHLNSDYIRISEKIKRLKGVEVPPMGFAYRKDTKTFLVSKDRPELTTRSKKILIEMYERDFDTFGYEKIYK